MQRAVAVIDSQNVRGWSRRVLGVDCYPQVDGIVTTMRDYGFEVDHVFVGLAVVHPRRSPSWLRNSRLKVEADQYLAVLKGIPNATPLIGYLAGERGQVTEKQVDVLCALDVALMESAPGSTVLLFSEDQDLEPALIRARARGVTAIRVVADASFVPGDSRVWLLERNLREVFQLDHAETLCGHDLRRSLGVLLLTANYSRDFVVTGSRTSIGGRAHTCAVGPGGEPALVSHSHGQFTVGTTLSSWHVQGLAPLERGGFPEVEIGPQPAKPTSNTCLAVVNSRPSATTAFLDVKNAHGRQRVSLPPGGPTRGDEVLVYPAAVRNRGGSEWRYVCTTSRPSAISISRPHLGRVLAPRANQGGNQYVSCSDFNARLLGSNDQRYAPDTLLAVWVMERPGAGRAPACVALSDPLG